MFWSSWLSMLLVVVAQAQRQGRQCVVDGVEMCRYESHKEMINKLQSLQRQYPQLVKVGTQSSPLSGVSIYPENKTLKYNSTGWLYREVSVGTTLGVRQAEQRCWSAELPRADGEVCGKHAR